MVSAITDAVEVTINNKSKDRESPVKNKKREHKEQPKEEKPVLIREEKQQSQSQQQHQLQQQPTQQQYHHQHKETVTTTITTAAVAATVVATTELKDSSNVEEKKNSRRDKGDSKSRNSFTSEQSLESAPLTNLPNVNAQDSGEFFFSFDYNALLNPFISYPFSHFILYITLTIL